jgi:tRNA dimethylallyltransferase
MQPKVLILVGPTASGKSALGVELARRFKGEVISADSRQVYRGLDIGTGKITKKEMEGVPHHLLDVASPKRPFSAQRFARSAGKEIATMIYHSGLPIVVGGTGFYIDALLGRIALPDVAPDTHARAALKKRSAAQLYAQLKQIDPARALALSSPSERNNKARLIRAIEIVRALGSVPALSSPTPPYDALWIGIVPTDVELKRGIAERLRARMKRGMVAEAKRLHARGLSYKRMRELGLEYRSLARHLQGEITLSEMQRELESDIWRYARKQIGYWKRNKDISWFHPKDRKEIRAAVAQWLEDKPRM